jgi:uncharacterized membrane protein
MSTNNKARKSGPLTRAFLKGLSIVLPAIITIALFAWIWDILRVNVVELLIRGIDSVAVFEDRTLSAAERSHLQMTAPARLAMYDKWVEDGKPVVETPLKHAELPAASGGYSPPMEKRGLLQVILDANHWQREYDPVSGRPTRFHWFEYLLASIIGLALVVLLGFAARNFLGRRLVGWLEWFVNRAPIIRSVYPHAKQLVEFFFGDKKPLEFDTVCAIEYPRERVWAIAFVTGSGIQSLQAATGKRFVTVYIPSSPAPMTGYTMFVPVEEVIRLDISVEDAMKLVISGGVLSPTSEKVTPVSGAQFALSHKIDKQVRDRQTSILNKTDMMAALKDKPEDKPAS